MTAQLHREVGALVGGAKSVNDDPRAASHASSIPRAPDARNEAAATCP
jgi:hypothetical protein